MLPFLWIPGRVIGASHRELGKAEVQTSEEPSVSRRISLEHALRDAIAERVRVLIWYKKEPQQREFEPATVYRSRTGRVCVSGLQVANAADPTENFRPHEFEVGLIRTLGLTKISFTSNP